jgi:flagellar basal body-associated protein FliL
MPDEAPPPEAAPKPKKKLPLTMIIIVGVSLAEAVGFFAVFNYLGRGPAPAHGEGSHVISSEPTATAAPGEVAKPAEKKEGEAKPAEKKEGEAKPAERKEGEAQPAEGKEGEAKPAETKAGEGDGKEEGGAPPAAAASATGLAEVIILKNFRVPNKKSGRLFIYDMDVSIVVPAADKPRLEKITKERSGEIADAVARIMRRATEKTLTEDDLRALRQQIKEGILEVIKEEKLVQRILIPRFVPIRAD